MNAHDLCFATYEGWGGCVTSCRHAAAVLGGSWAAFAKQEARDGLAPERVYEAELLVLSGWDESYVPLLERRKRATVIRWHSPILQSELSEEGWKVARIVELLDAGELAALAVDDPALATVLARERVFHLPVVLDEADYAGVRPERLAGINVSLFGDGHWRKNLLVQSAAFERARRAAGDAAWTLQLNGQTVVEPSYRTWLEATGVRFVDHGRLERGRYLALVAAMDAGLSATLSESYCYVAADHVVLGVPAVVSAAVTCLPGPELRVGWAGDVDEVAAGLQLALSRRQLVVAQRASLLEQAAANAERAHAALAELAYVVAANPCRTRSRNSASSSSESGAGTGAAPASASA